MTTPATHSEVADFADAICAAIERILACLDGLDAEGLNWRPPAPQTNSLYVLAFHSMGSAEASIIGELGGQPVERDRDAEFTASSNSTAPLSARWAALQPRLRETLNRLTPADMEKTVHHRRFGAMSGRAYVILAAQHPAEHAGHAELTHDLLKAARG
ncbi:MAG: DinB family protein [Thermomicrobiales bacterium]